MSQKYTKDARLTSKNDLQLTALSEPTPTKIFALGLIVNKEYKSAVVFTLQSVASYAPIDLVTHTTCAKNSTLKLGVEEKNQYVWYNSRLVGRA